MEPSLRLDPDLQAIFAGEAEFRLDRLASGVGRLADDGNDDRLIDSLFGDTHTLKGAAAVLRFDDIARVAHAMEEVLSGVRAEGGPPAPAVTRTLGAAVDALRLMVGDQLAGRAVSRQAAAQEAALLGVAVGRAEPWPPATAADPVAEAARGPRQATIAPVKLVHFRTGHGHFAVPIDAVVTVRSAGGVVGQPGGGGHIVGVVQHDGDNLPVADLLGGGDGHVLVLAAGAQMFGLLVEQVLGGVSVPPGELGPPPADHDRVVDGVVHLGHQLALIVDPAALAEALER